MNISLAFWIRIYLVGLILAAAADASAFKIDTHQKLNNKAAVASNLDTYLKEQLAIGDGLEETFKEKKVREWIELGGEAEDEFLTSELLGAAFRSRHHFHNPLLSWDQAGLNARSLCPPFVLVGEASVRWAQDPNQGLSGQATWIEARQSFLQALTLPKKTDRDAAFARTFQILGQQMHLVEDLAAPAHTRNDPHCPSPDGFEAWVSKLENQPFIGGLIAAPPVRPEPSIFTVGVPISDLIAKVPVARLWDTDQYKKTNPDITLSPTIGIAEYSNANFFSDNTVFSTELPFPASTSVELGLPEPEPKTGELRRYFKKVRDGEPIDHLAVPSALYEFLPEALKDNKKGLDDNVFQGYAVKLLPRAVGYSAALLDYFFRGRFAVERMAPDLNEGNVGYVYVQVRNLGDERMAGRITFYYDDPKDGLRKVAPTQPFIIDLDPGASAEHSFNTLVDRGPDRMESRYIAVFDGRLGDDPNAVVASNLQITPPRPAFVCLGPDYCYMWFFGPPAGATLTIEATGTGNSGSVTAMSAGCTKTECISEIPVSFGGAPAVSTWSFTAPAAPPVSDDGSSFSLDPLNVEAGGFVCIFDYWSSPITPEGDTVVKYASRGFSYSNCPEEARPSLLIEEQFPRPLSSFTPARLQSSRSAMVRRYTSVDAIPDYASIHSSWLGRTRSSDEGGLHPPRSAAA